MKGTRSDAQSPISLLRECEWYLPQQCSPTAPSPPSVLFAPPVSMAVLKPQPDSFQSSIKQYLKLHDFLAALQHTDTPSPQPPDFPEFDCTPAPCPHQLPSTERKRLLQIPFPEELSEAVFATLNLQLLVMIRVKGSLRICSLSVNNGEFWTREERESSQDARVAAHLKALEWAVPNLLQEWRVRYRQ